MMVFVVEPHYNYMIIDHVMHFLYALHALPLAFHALSSIVVLAPTFYDFNNPLLRYSKARAEVHGCSYPLDDGVETHRGCFLFHMKIDLSIFMLSDLQTIHIVYICN